MKKGFTLIELLIVIAIIGILAVAFLPSLLGAPAKGRDTTRIEQVGKIQTYLVSMSLTNPSGLPDSGCVDSSVGNPPDKTINKLIGDNLADFGGIFPMDPKPVGQAMCQGKYGYIKYDPTAKTGYTAAVYAVVENLDKANIKCSSLKNNIKPALTPGKVEVDANEVYGCYVALVQ